jgi:tetratricopeptide (TPR) repeat protein
MVQQKGLYEDAIAFYTSVIDLKPLNVYVVYFFRGSTYSQMGLADQAINDFNQAISLNANFVDAHIERGFVYISKGDMVSAERDFHRAIELNPDYPYAHFGMALISYYGWQDFQSASSYCEDAQNAANRSGDILSPRIENECREIKELLGPNAITTPLATAPSA